MKLSELPICRITIAFFIGWDFAANNNTNGWLIAGLITMAVIDFVARKALEDMSNGKQNTKSGPRAVPS